jgi:hypothetical protein
MKDNWLYVAKRQGKLKLIKAFDHFDPEKAEWPTNVNEAAEFTEAEWKAEGAMEFISRKDEHMCLVSYADDPRKTGERPTRIHGKASRKTQHK